VVFKQFEKVWEFSRFIIAEAFTFARENTIHKSLDLAEIDLAANICL